MTGGVGAVEADDAEVLDLLAPAVRAWWKEQFGDYREENGGYFTPPQRGAIPHIAEGGNTLICAPTGSGKCVKPDTPLIIEENGTVQVIRAEELLEKRTEKIADIDENGELYSSDVNAFALSDGSIEKHPSLIYSEPYSEQIHRIATTYGREVEVTPSHPLLVETDEGCEWRKAKNIRSGDRIGVPKRIDLPELPVHLPVDEALAALRERFPVVLTHRESVELVAAVESASGLVDLSERDIRRTLALAELPMEEVANGLSISLASVCRQVTHHTDYQSDGLLELLRENADPLEENEIVVKANNGRTSRFTYPTTVDENLSKLCAFVVAEGLLAEYDKNAMLMISQRNRTNLLADAMRTMKEVFGVEFRPKNEIDYVIADTPFSIFFSKLTGIEMGRSRDVPLPGWLLNAPKPVKRAFVSTFLSLEAEVSENEVRVIQANEIKIEQLNYLFLSFGIFPSRGSVFKYATNTEGRRSREYYTLTVRGKSDLSTLVSEFDVCHPNIDRLARYAEGEGNGNWIDRFAFDYADIRQLLQYYANDREFNRELGSIYEVVRRSGRITGRALKKLHEIVATLPEDQLTRELSERIERLQEDNVMWLDVTSTETHEFDGRVIDLTVPGPHNFVGGRGGLYLHNTLASFTAIINDLYCRAEQGDLDDAVYCLYISPLKSLANDIHRNLEVPLSAITEGTNVEIRHAIRHGDTGKAARGRMREKPPHILNTTPETLAILLCSPVFRESLRTVEYVIVDEIHSVAAGKRGTHLAVSLERLEALADASPTRIGCSATVEPLDEVSEFLVGRETPGGPPRECAVVDARFVREFDLELVCPADDLVGTPRWELQDRFYDLLHGYVSAHDTTLVFTNTRSGAERVLYNLRERFPGRYDEDNSGCHHGSLAEPARTRVEEMLKAGEADVVTTSTSLELGIDMPTLDLVVQVGSPKSVTSLLQRVGRAGHRPGDTVKGRVIALDRDDLLECAVMLARAREGFVDRTSIPEGAHDVAAQHVFGMAVNAVRPEAEVRGILRRAYPYRNYTDTDWEALLRYLTADYPGLAERNIYAKVWRDENDPPDGEHHHPAFPVGERLLGKRGRLARPIYLQNVGTIPDSFSCTVLTREEREWVGDLDEAYLDTIDPGDVFVLGGRRFEYRYRRGSNVYVDPTDDRPTVPSWFAERLPLSPDLAREILAFQAALVDRLEQGGSPAARAWLRGFPLDEASVYALARLFDEQVRYAGPESVSTPRRLVVEEERDRARSKRRFYVHSVRGRRFNDGLSRLLAGRCAQSTTPDVSVAVADHGFTLSMPLNRKVDVAGLLRGIDPEAVRDELRASLDGTDLLERSFRINATRSLMVLRRYRGREKSARKQQVAGEMLLGYAQGLGGFAPLEETYRELLTDRLDADALEAFFASVRDGDIAVEHLVVDSPSPRAFGLATLSSGDIAVANDADEALRRFDARVRRAIDGEDAG